MPPEQEQSYPDDPLAGGEDVNTTTDEQGETTRTYNTMDPYDKQRQVRLSTYKRKSFVMEFVQQKGPPQILILCLLLALGFGSTIGVVPAVMMDRYARLHHGFTDPHDCSTFVDQKPAECLAGSADAQNAAAYESLVNNLFTFITSSLMGSLSDEYGRRGILLLGLFLSCLSPTCLVLLQLRPQMSPLWYYGLGSLSGLVSWISVALSALSDVLPRQWRAPGFGLLLAGFSLGFAGAPSLALLLNHFQVSVAAVILTSGAWILTYFTFPETLSEETATQAQLVRTEQAAQYCDSSNNNDDWAQIWYMLKRPIRELSILNRNSFFRLLSCLAFFSGMVAAGDRTLLVYYIEERLAFNDHDVAITFLIMGLLGILVQGVLIKPINDVIGERWVVFVAFVLGACHNLLYGLARTKWEIYLAVAIGSFGGMSMPTISAIKANNVAESEQGRIQGALYSIQALAAGVGPMAMRFIYHLTKELPYPGAGSMFLFAATLYLVAAGIAWLLPKDKANSARRHHSYSDIAEVDESSMSTNLLRETNHV